MTVILFGMTLTCTTAIALDLLAIELNSAYSLDRMNAIIDSFIMMSNMLVYSCLSEFISSDLIEIGDFFYNLAWYQLPVEKQKLFGLPIQRAQRIFQLNGMGLCNCSLEVFSKVFFYAAHVCLDNFYFSNRNNELCIYSFLIIDYSNCRFIFSHSSLIPMKTAEINE